MDELYHAPVGKKRFPTPKSGYKYCYACEQELLLREFALRKGKPWSYCMACDRTRDAARRQPYASPNPRPNPRNAPKPVPARDGYKWCTACGQEKRREEFHKTRGATCIACERAIDRERNRARRVRKTPVIPKATRDGYKVCNTCLDEKPHTDFSRVGDGDGYAGRCKKCRNERYNRVPDDEKVRRSIARKDYEDQRREEIRAAERTRFSTDEYRSRRRIRERPRKEAQRVGQTIDCNAILARDGWWCYICDKEILPEQKFEFDHVIPLTPVLGEPQGTHSFDNIKPTHAVCNQRKGNKQVETLTRWARRGP